MTERLGTFLLVFFLTSAANATRRTAVAHAARTAPLVDGSLLDWNPGMYGIAPPISIAASTSFVEEGKIADDADHSAELFSVFTADELIVACIVRDDHVVSDFRGGEIWKGDMIEVLVARPGGYLHVGVSPNGDHHVFSSKDARYQADEKRIRAAARVEAPGYLVELAIPFKAFGATGREEALSVNFAARDVDPGKPPAHRTWSGYRHNSLASFGTLILRKPTVPVGVWPSCSQATGMVRVDRPLRAENRRLLSGQAPIKLRMVNFQSADESWIEFWTHWSLDEIERGLSAAERLGTNSIRIFVHWEAFEGANVSATMLNRLSAVIDAAAARGMLSVVSFFPFKKEFRPERWPEMESHLRQVVRRFRGSPAVAMWDLMNEPDHSWAEGDGGVSASDVMAWAAHMAAAARQEDPTHLITIGLAGHFTQRPLPVRDEELLPLVDVLSIHWYFPLERLGAGLELAQKAIERPLIIQEFGATGMYYDETSAAKQYAAVCRQAAASDVSGVGAWELFDHPVGSIAWYKERWKEAEENYFGLLRTDGSPKLQAGAFCNCLQVPRFRIVPSMRN